MPAIPASTNSSVTLRLLAHAEHHWPQLKRVEVTYRGTFGYVTGVLRDGEQIPLCRLRYGGSAHSFGFAIYSAARKPPCSPGSAPAVPKTPSTPPAPSTSPTSASDRRRPHHRPLINPRRTSSP